MNAIDTKEKLDELKKLFTQELNEFNFLYFEYFKELTVKEGVEIDQEGMIEEMGKLESLLTKHLNFTVLCSHILIIFQELESDFLRSELRNFKTLLNEQIGLHKSIGFELAEKVKLLKTRYYSKYKTDLF